MNKFNDTDLKMKDNELTEEEEVIKENDMPAYMNPLELSEEQKDRLKKCLSSEFEQLKEERDELGLEDKIDDLETQYWSDENEYNDSQFALHVPETKTKVDSIVRDMHQAYAEIDPKYTVTPRPEFDKKGGREVAIKQQDFLDFKIDNNGSFDTSGRLVEHNATLHGIGWEKYRHVIRRRKRKRTERYEPNIEQVIDPNTGDVAINPETGQPIVKNEALEEFILKYQDQLEAQDRTVIKYAKKLAEGKTIDVEVEYYETIYNDVLPSSVKPKNLYIHPDIVDYDDLCQTNIIMERTEWRYHELKAEEAKGFFTDVEELLKEKDENGKDVVKDENRYKLYNVMECTYDFYLNEEDEEPVRVLAWIEEDSWTFLGAIYFPYEGLDCLYNPANVKIKKDSLYQPGIAEDLTVINVVQDTLINFGLEGAFISNMVTPIVPENSSIAIQFLNKDWWHGVPLEGETGEIDFLNNKIRPADLGAMIAGMQVVGSMADEVTGKNRLSNSPQQAVDVNAPVRTTMAAIAQTDKNIRDYLMVMQKFYNRRGTILLQMYYEISKDGQKYKVRPENVVGDNPFDQLTREEMVAKTNIESRVYAFDFDRQNEKREYIALLQLVLSNPITAQNPLAINAVLRQLIKSWSPSVKNMVDQIAPTMEQLNAEMQQRATLAVAQYFNAKAQEAQSKGVPPESIVNPQEIQGVVNQAANSVVAPPEEEKK